MTTSSKWFMAILTLMMLTSPGQAEVYLDQDRLTVNVSETTAKDVLNDVALQGHITIVVLDHTQIGQVKISRRFWNIPLEEGLERILNGWNYGLSRNRLTGKISTVYLLAQRIRTVSPSQSQPILTHNSQNISPDDIPAQPMVSSRVYDKESSNFEPEEEEEFLESPESSRRE